MPINDIAHGLPRIGKIRIGETVEYVKDGETKSRPKKLDTFKLTSPDEQVIVEAASTLGGTAGPWDNDGSPEFAVVTNASVLDVLITPEDDAFSQNYELWSGGGCQRRCDGFVESLSGGTCVCPDDKEKRRDEAAKGKACKPTTRVSVVLPQIPRIGAWLIESHGYYAARELGSTFALLDLAGARRGLLKARLRIEQRVSKKPGQPTNHYGVPVLDIGMSFDTLLGASSATGEVGGGDQPALPAPVTSPKKAAAVKKAAAQKSIVEQSQQVKDDPITAEELATFQGRIAVLDPEHRSLCATLMKNASVTLKTTPKKSEARAIEQVLGAVEGKQAEAWESRRNAVFGALAELDLSEEQRHQFILDATAGVTESTKTLTQEQANAIIEAAGGTPEQQSLGGDAA